MRVRAPGRTWRHSINASAARRLTVAGLAAALAVTTVSGSCPAPAESAPAPVAAPDTDLINERLAEQAERATRSATRPRAWGPAVSPALAAVARGVPAARKQRPRPVVSERQRTSAKIRERVSSRKAVTRPLRKVRKVVRHRAVRVAVGARAGASRVLAYAYRQIGKPYVRGADGPGSFDCSGLTLRAFELAGVDLPHKAAAQSGRRISAAEARPGDLVKWGGYHVGIYAGRGMVIHAPKPGDHVKISRLWGRYRFVRLL